MFKAIKSGFHSMCASVKKHAGKALTALGAGAGAVMQTTSAHADLLADTKTSIELAAANTLTVGGYVVAGVASLIVIGLIISMIYKMR